MASTLPKASETIFAARRAKIIRQIKGEVALFCASPANIMSRDLEHLYQPDSDFYYLTGVTEDDAALVLSGKQRGPRSVLYLRDRDLQREKWVGERLGITRARRRIKVDDVRSIEQLPDDLPKLLENCSVLHFMPGVDQDIDHAVFDLFSTRTAPRLTLPNSFADARLITSEMRWVKDKAEISHLRYAANITAKSFLEIAPRLREFSNEQHCGAELESLFYKRGASSIAFPTIVASGKHATTLHHSPSSSPLWRKELLLIDAGARYFGYCGDVTRTFPVSGKFSTPQAEVYIIVHKALQAAITKAKPGNTMNAIHMAAVQEIVKGLTELKILRGKISARIKDESYRPYFMHRTGHWLGLDAHDISPILSTNAPIHSYTRPLVPGNVITVEPGLYFDPHDTTIPSAYRGIGVRIEDDVLITQSGHEVLSSAMPTARSEIEALMS